MDFDVMPRSQGRRMQTAIKRTTAGERPCAAKPSRGESFATTRKTLTRTAVPEKFQEPQSPPLEQPELPKRLQCASAVDGAFAQGQRLPTSGSHSGVLLYRRYSPACA
eukprot:IDg14951t1